jgi:hypothetical protein
MFRFPICQASLPAAIDMIAAQNLMRQANTFGVTERDAAKSIAKHSKAWQGNTNDKSAQTP